MHNKSLTVLCATAVMALTACGGGSGEPTGPNQTANGTLSAKIDGVSWSPTVISASAGSGALIVATADGTGRGFAFAVAITQGLGTQTLGPASVVNANSAFGGQGWLATPNLGGSGSVTLTTLETNRAAGTFTFALQGISPSTNPATLHVTEGRFDVLF